MVESIAATLRSQEGQQHSARDDNDSPPSRSQTHTVAGHAQDSRPSKDSTHTHAATNIKHSSNPRLDDPEQKSVSNNGASSGAPRHNVTSDDPTTSQTPKTTSRIRKSSGQREPSPETMSVEQRLRDQQRQLRRQQLSASQREFPTPSSATPSRSVGAGGALGNVPWVIDDDVEGDEMAVGEEGHASGRRTQRNAPVG